MSIKLNCRPPVGAFFSFRRRAPPLDLERNIFSPSLVGGFELLASHVKNMLLKLPEIMRAPVAGIF
jgi:hypothetical protein